MDHAEFMKCEYLTLREEIKDTKDRIFKLAGFGIAGVPGAYYLANVYKLEILVYTLPILIIIIALLYLAESRALMRCGRYIRTRLEEQVKDENGAVVGGWEKWLETRERGEPNRRSVDKYATAFFYLLFTIYYAAAVSMASHMAGEHFGVVGCAVVLGAYIGVGAAFIAFLIGSIKYCISTHD